MQRLLVPLNSETQLLLLSAGIGAASEQPSLGFGPLQAPANSRSLLKVAEPRPDAFIRPPALYLCMTFRLTPSQEVRNRDPPLRNAKVQTRRNSVGWAVLV